MPYLKLEGLRTTVSCTKACVRSKDQSPPFLRSDGLSEGELFNGRTLRGRSSLTASQMDEDEEDQEMKERDPWE